ncbi:MAG: NAD(P)-binding domain-containing protein [Acidimicrobiia bacterium]
MRRRPPRVAWRRARCRGRLVPPHRVRRVPPPRPGVVWPRVAGARPRARPRPHPRCGPPRRIGRRARRRARTTRRRGAPGRAPRPPVHRHRRRRARHRFRRGRRHRGAPPLPRSRDPHLLVVGAGEIASAIVRLLAAADLGTVTVANRNDHRAAELAGAYGVSYTSWSQLPEALRRADVVVAATSAPAPLLDAEILGAAVAGRRRNLLAIDVGFPHNVVAVPGVRVVGLDELDGATDALAARRLAAVPAVEAIVEEAVQAWTQTARALELEDLVKSLSLDLTFLAQDIAPALAAMRDSDAVQRSFHRAVTRLLHPYLEQLRSVVLTPGTEVLDNPQEVVTG